MVSPPFPSKTRICIACKRMLLRLTEEEHHRQIYGKCFLKHLVWYDSFTWNNCEKTRSLECTKSWYILCIFLHCCQVLIDVLLVFNCTGFPRHGLENHPMATTPYRDMGTLLGMAHSLPKCVPQSMEIIHLEVHPLPTIPFFRSCGSKPCAVFIVRGAQVRRGCLCLVGVWTIHLKHSEIYVCQKMGHFSPIFLGVNTSLTEIFEANTIYS